MVSYTLPDPFLLDSGLRVQSEGDWWEKRRPEILRHFEHFVYGKSLPVVKVRAEVVERKNDALDGEATRIRVDLSFPGYDGPMLQLMLYLPNAVKAPVPAFLGLSFYGHEGSFADPDIPLSTRWMRSDFKGVENNRSTEATRGIGVSRWPVKDIIRRGYALAVVYYGDIEPDHEQGFAQSVRAMFSADPHSPEGDAPGAISAWAWGLSRVMDYLVTLPEIDAKRVCLTGHSRLGKTSLWAAATDTRFAAVISNNSGCGGGSISRRNYGEPLHFLSNVRPHWFCENCRTKSINIEKFPVDQHLLLSLIAPRPVLLACAEEDLGADPFGEFLSCVHASPVFEFLGATGLTTKELPPVNHPLFSTVGYSLRPGPHAITPDDWKTHIDFVDKYFG